MSDNHEGKILQKYLEDNKVSPYDLAKTIGVTAQSIYLQIKKEIVSNTFKLKLRKAKIDIYDKQNFTTVNKDLDVNLVFESLMKNQDYLSKEIVRAKDEVIKAKDETIRAQQTLLKIGSGEKNERISKIITTYSEHQKGAG